MSVHDNSGFFKPQNDAIRIPHAIELEQGVLGAILLDNANFEIVSSRIDASVFYEPLHAEIYGMITARITSGQSVSPISLRQFVVDWPAINQETPVWKYLGNLVAAATTRMELPNYARDLLDIANKRQLVGIGQDLVARATATRHDTSAMEILEAAESDLFAVAQRRTESRDMPIATAVHSAVEVINAAYERGGELAGTPTGLIDLDAKLGGLQDSDLVILAGRPAMGKTALITNIAYHVATTQRRARGDDKPKLGHVHFFSQEMSAQQLAMRVLADRSEIASDSLRRGKLTEDEFRQVVQHAQKICNASMTIDETGGITLAQLAAKARREKRRKGTTLIVIDYLQLMSGGGRSTDNRVQEITQITTGLKALAKELNVPIVALSQLSRKVEDRADKRPQLSDLRESGSIEQDADVVMFVFREEYYVEREKPAENDAEATMTWHKRMSDAHGKAEVIIGKQRHGPVGTVTLSFESQFTRFGNLAKPQHVEVGHG